MKGDLHAGQQNPGGFDVLPMDEQGDEMMATIGEREIWLGRDHQYNNLLDDVTVAAADCNSFFYTDFPPLPDFPCMSSSSSSSSTPALLKPIATPSASSASSSSSAASASWAMFKSDAEQPQPQQQQSKQSKCDGLAAGAGAGAALSSTASMEGGFQPSDGGIILEDVDCMDVMEDFGYMDLIDGNDIWDPSSIFHQNPDEHGEAGEYSNEEEQVSDFMLQGNCEVVQEKEERLGLDELGVMFFEWLKTNKEHISAEDMRNIKLKRATIECASKRLGSTKEGRKQLLKLILEWVEQYQLQKKRSREEAQAQEEEAAAAASQIPCQYNQEQQPFPNPNPNLINSVPIDPNTCFSPSWIPPPPPPYVADPAAVMAAPPPPVFLPVVGYMGGDPYANGTLTNCHPYPPPTEYQMLDSAQSWPPSQFAFSSFTENGNFTPIVPQPQHVHPLVYGDQYNSYPVFNGNGTERLDRLGSSATKEARKKRMARQRRSSVHHYRHHHPSQNLHHNDTSEQQQNCTNNAQANPGNWVYWPAAGGSASSTVPMLAQPPMDAPPPRQRQPVDPASVQPQSYQRQAQSDRRLQQQPAYKVEKNLKFLLQKVLKQSDVGNLGRIVLPKKEAETQLPELEARDGMPIAMEDIGTSKVWNMRYSLRFWPNNKSRMYLLENTGEFVKANGLQEGDFIVIYSDIKCGKYLIRGVKVRQPGPKEEGKKPAKRNHRNSSAAAGNGNSSKLNTH